MRVLTDPSVAAQLPAWSPDGNQLAWCSGPDAGFLDKQKLISEDRKSITVEGPLPGERRVMPITSHLHLGAEQDTIERSLRMRRIYTSTLSDASRPRQLTRDARYSDEEPVWSAGGGHILFCRVDANDKWTIWLMRSDGSDTRQIAGPLRPPPDLSNDEKFGYKLFYGHTDWRSLFDWWQQSVV